MEQSPQPNIIESQNTDHNLPESGVNDQPVVSASKSAGSKFNIFHVIGILVLLLIALVLMGKVKLYPSTDDYKKLSEEMKSETENITDNNIEEPTSKPEATNSNPAQGIVYDSLDENMSQAEYRAKMDQLSTTGGGGYETIIQGMKSGQIFGIVIPLNVYATKQGYDDGKVRTIAIKADKLDIEITHLLNVTSNGLNSTEFCEQYLSKDGVKLGKEYDMQNYQPEFFAKGQASSHMAVYDNGSKYLHFNRCLEDGGDNLWAVDAIFAKDYADENMLEVKKIMKSFDFVE